MIFSKGNLYSDYFGDFVDILDDDNCVGVDSVIEINTKHSTISIETSL